MKHSWQGFFTNQKLCKRKYQDELFISAPPAFEIKTRSQTALKGESTVLSCEAKGEKPIGILWNMNHKRLDSLLDPRYTVRQCSIHSNKDQL